MEVLELILLAKLLLRWSLLRETDDAQKRKQRELAIEVLLEAQLIIQEGKLGHDPSDLPF